MKIPNKSSGYYFGKYDIAVGEYSGVDFSRKCFIFPGQSAAFPGMFRQQYLEIEAVRKKIETADLLAGKKGLQKISDYILNPKKIKKEKLPIIRNLALLTMDVAIFESLVSSGEVPMIITGHSFGEYGALVAAGIISFEEMFEIVHYRDSACPESNSLGFMIAVGADTAEIGKVLENGTYHISNLNSNAQTVISVSPGNIEKFEKILKEKKLAYKILSNVPQPYHCPYLDGVKIKIEKYIENKKINFKKPEIPVFSSVIGKLIDENNFNEGKIRQILTGQIVTPVNFISQISAIHGLGCSNFVEINEKKVFSFFVENILADKEIKTDVALNLLKSEKKEISKNISAENSKLFALVSKVIGEITGYEIEKISLEDRFQEDLGIDSIKKADILLTVLDKSAINPGDDFNTSKFGSIRDTVEYLQNAGSETSAGTELAPRRETFFQRYVFLWKEKPLDAYFLAPDEKKECMVFEIAEIYESKEALLEKLNMFFKKNEGFNKDMIVEAKSEEFEYGKLILFFDFWNQFLKTVETGRFNLVLVSQGASSPLVSGYSSFFKSMKKELPGMFFKHVHFENAVTESHMSNLALKELREPFDIDVLYKNQIRYVSVRNKAKKTNNEFVLGENSVVLAIGGAKGITFSLLRNISKKYKPIIFLAGRSAQEDRVVADNLAELKKNNSEIYYESLDARDSGSLEKLFEKIKNKYGKIDLVINGAGAVSIGFIKEKKQADVEKELGNKILPALNVLNLSTKYGAERIMNFSSIISKYGSAGQSVYTMANEIIGAFTEKHRKALVIHWPPWDGVGMTEQKGILKNLSEQGVSLLESMKADDLFSQDLGNSGLKSVYYMDKDDDKLYGFSLNNFSNWQPLLGELTDPFNISAQRQVFEKTFDLAKDAYLKDHKIKGAAYVPAAVGMVMFFCLAKLQNKNFQVLENFIISNPIIVKDDPIRCHLKVEKKNSVSDLAIKSNVLNFSCRTGGSQEEKTFHYEMKKAVNEIIVDSIYSDYYFKDSLYLGLTFQTIDRAFLDAAENPFFRIDNSKLLPVLGLGAYDKLIQWIDVSFQALSAVGLKNNLKFIPVKVSKFSSYFNNKVTNYLYVIPSVTEIDGSDIMGDIVVINENKEVILEMKGAHMKSVNKHSENRLKIIRYEEK